MPQRSVEGLIIAARAGDAEALGTLLERHRDQLRHIARKNLDFSIQGRIDPSDVIQQTFLEAEQGFHTFRGEAGPQFFAWIRKILENNAANTVRFHLQSRKRSVRRERSTAGGSSQNNGWDLILDKGSSPSHRAIRGEDKKRMLQSLEQLPAGQRVAIFKRYIEQQSVIDIAKEMGRTRLAVAGLLKRGLRQLQSQMAIDQKGPDG